MSKIIGNPVGTTLPKPNWNQTDPTKGDYIKNKPFYEEKIVMEDTLTWDGNTEGKEVGIWIDKTGKSVNLYRISEETPSYDWLMNDAGFTIRFEDGSEETDKQSESHVKFGERFSALSGGKFYICYEDNMQYTNPTDSFEFPKKGIYIPEYDPDEPSCNLVSLTINGYRFERTEIHYLDPKYIKDMYYTGDLVETVIIEETTIQADSFEEWDDGIYGCEILLAQPIEFNQNYTVIFDGVTYELTAFYDYGDVAIGSPYDEILNNTDCPFEIYHDGSHWLVVTDNTSHTISIVGHIPEIHQINPKYIKDMYYEYLAPNNDYVCGTAISTEYDNAWVNNDTLFIENFLVKDATYEVNWNGQMYTCVARQSGYGEIYIGNQALAIEADWEGFLEIIESNEPFFFYTLASNYDEDYGLLVQTAGEYTIDVYGVGEKMTPYKIDRKYLPEIIDYKFDSISGMLSNKMNTWNPTGSGSFSMNRKAGTTIGSWSHAEGNQTTASGNYGSHAEGRGTIASGNSSHVQGKWNIDDIDADGNPLNTHAHIVGNGTTEDTRSNAHTLDWAGNAWFAGDVYVGSASGINKDEGSKKLATTVSDEELLELLMESGIADPAANSAGALYTDNNGKVYTL